MSSGGEDEEDFTTGSESDMDPFDKAVAEREAAAALEASRARQRRAVARRRRSIARANAPPKPPTPRVPTSSRPATVYSEHGTELSGNASEYTWTTFREPVEPEEEIPPQQELWEAVEDGDEWDVAMLIEEGECNINFRNREMRYRTSLHVASRLGYGKVVSLLLKEKPRVSEQDEDGRTPLMDAAERGHLIIVRSLLVCDADVELVDLADRTALMLAAKNGFTDVVLSLIRGKSPIEAVTRAGWTAVTFAARWGHADCMRALLEAGAEHDPIDRAGRTPLLYAAREGKLAAVEELLRAGADVNTTDPENGWPSATYATQNGHAAVVAALVDAGSPVDYWDYKDASAMTIACITRKPSVVEVLLPRGARVTNRDVMIVVRNGCEEIKTQLAPLPVTDACAELTGLRPKHTTGKILVTWTHASFYDDPLDAVQEYTVTREPDPETIKVKASTVMRVVFEECRFEVEYNFVVVASGYTLLAPPTPTNPFLVMSHIGKWLRDVGLYEDAYRPVLDWLAGKDEGETFDLSSFTKLCKPEDVPDIVFATQPIADRFATELDIKTREILFAEGKPWIIRKEDMDSIVEWKGLVRVAYWRNRRVTVLKVGKNARSSSRIEELMRDAIVLTEFDNDHLVAVVGYCLDPVNSLVFEQPLSPTLAEWCSRQSPVDAFLDSGRRNFAIATRTQIVREIARGLVYVHEEGFVHGDLRSSCVYLESLKGGQVVAKLSEYGLVRTKERWDADREARKETPVPGFADYVAPNQWQAPAEVSPASDVYAFGVLMLEVFAGDAGLRWLTPAPGCPFTNRASFMYRAWVAKACVAGHRPVGPTSVLPSVLTLIKSCTAQLARDRPPMAAVMRELDHLCEEVYQVDRLSQRILLPETPMPTPRRVVTLDDSDPESDLESVARVEDDRSDVESAASPRVALSECKEGEGEEGEGEGGKAGGDS